MGTLIKPRGESIKGRKLVAAIWAKHTDDFEYKTVCDAFQQGKKMEWNFDLTPQQVQQISEYADVQTGVGVRATGDKDQTDKLRQTKDTPPPPRKADEDNDDPTIQLRDAIERLAQNAAGLNEDQLRAFLDEHVRDMNEAAADMENHLNQRIAELKAPNIVKVLGEGEQPEVKWEGLAHKNFGLLLRLCQARNPDGMRLNVWMTGPAGSGKTTGAKNVADALFKDGKNEKGDPAFMAQGTSDQKYDLVGFRDATGGVVTTEFRRVYRDGGVILIDEVDGWFPNALLAINSATANPFAIFPDGIVPRHKDTIIICAANTFGHGEVTEYVGRMKQDAAFLDRFIFLDWPIDEDLESTLCSSQADWCEYVQAVRGRIAGKGYKVLVTPRASIFGSSLLEAGLDRDTVAEMTIKKGMTPDMWDAVK